MDSSQLTDYQKISLSGKNRKENSGFHRQNRVFRTFLQETDRNVSPLLNFNVHLIIIHGHMTIL
jgi:hypothetical protein